MRIIAFITYSADIRQILEHIGVEPEPPHITPARGPPLWHGCDAQMGNGGSGFANAAGAMLRREVCRTVSGSGPSATARSDLVQWRGDPQVPYFISCNTCPQAVWLPIRRSLYWMRVSKRYAKLPAQISAAAASRPIQPGCLPFVPMSTRAELAARVVL